MQSAEETEANELTWPSVDDVAPNEEGGPNARRGFTYQDEIAVGFLLDALDDPSVQKIHFETHDDLVIVRFDSELQTLTAEFVQVKAGESDKLWSVADLCHQPGKISGTSIFETSLNRDRHHEAARFRIVTLRPVVSALRPLTYEIGNEARALSGSEMVSLKLELESRFPNLCSPKKNGCEYWLQHCLWDQCYDQLTVARDNFNRLFAFSQKSGSPLLLEQLNVVLDEMRAWVKSAGDAKWVPDKAKKIVTRKQLLSWWNERKVKFAEEAASRSGGKLTAKMEDAFLPDDIVALAIDLRLEYAAEVRTPRYMESGDVLKLQRQVKSEV